RAERQARGEQDALPEPHGCQRIRRRSGTCRQDRGRVMPTQKTHSGAKKRFKITGSGKVKKQGAGMRHNLEGKSSKVTRRLNRDVIPSPQDAKVIKGLLGK